MLKLLKAKVLGNSSSPGVVVPNVSEKIHKQSPAVVRDECCVPQDFDIIDIDSIASPATSITESSEETTSVDVDKSYALSYRCAAAAKEYTLIKTINVGSTAKVQLAHHVGTSRQVALKIMKKNKQHVKYMNREVSIHKQLCHENIVELYDVIETPYHFVLALEYLEGGDLFDLVPPNEGCTEYQALVYLQQLVRAVAHMHSRNVVHRDIKPENCVSDTNGTLKLIDFGAASAADGPFTPAGTIPYMAPEMFDPTRTANSKWDLKAIDMWAVGIVYFTLLTGRFPWAVANEDRSPEYSEYMRDSLQHRYPWFKISEPSLHLLQGLLCPDPAQRFAVYEALAIVDTLLMRANAQLSTAPTPTGKRKQGNQHQREMSMSSSMSTTPIGKRKQGETQQQQSMVSPEFSPATSPQPQRLLCKTA